MDTVARNGKIYEVYNTKNRIILYLFRRFYQKIAALCKDIDTVNKYGLDVGCGEGHLTNMLYSEGLIKNQIAIDLDSDRISFAMINYPLEGINYLVKDIYTLDYEAKFDYVLALEILEHLPDAESALSALQRSAVKGGKFIFSVPYEPFFHLGNILRGKHLSRFGRTPSHLNFWTKREFLSLVSKYGKIVDVYSYTTFPWIVVKGEFHK